MTTFRTSLRIVARHWGYVLVYLLLISQMGLLTALAVGSGDRDVLREERAKVAVVDHDGSTLSQGVRHYLESTGQPTTVVEEREAMQDAIAQNRAEYILIIPAGYGARLAQAARGGQQPPGLEAVINNSVGNGVLMDQRLGTYLNQVYAYLALGSFSPEQAIRLADKGVEETARAEVIKNEAGAVPESMLIYAKMSTYPLLTSTSISIAVMMASLNKRSVRSRVLASPESGLARRLGLLATCLVIGAVCWAWICALGLVVLGLSLLSTAAPLLGVVGAALLAYTLVGVALGFLLGSLGVNRGWTDAVANISGMVFAFLAGAWGPSDMLPAGVVALSKLTPAYWATHAIQGAYESLDQSGQALWPLLADCGVCALFAVAIACVAMMLGRARSQATL